MSSDGIDSRRLQGSTTADGPPVVRAQVQSVPASLEHYKMNHDCPGVALIFSHMEFKNHARRDGSDKDADALGKVLLALGFDVRIFIDLMQHQVFEQLRLVSQNVDHTKHDCLVVVMMTHGVRGALAAADTDDLRLPPYKVERLWEHFDDDACPGLAGKPKLVFIQACRGDKSDRGLKVEVMRVGDTVGAPEDKGNACFIPTIPDSLVAYSTCEGHYSARNKRNGSWFIQELAKNLTEYGSKKDVLSLLTVVLRKVACNYKTYAPTKPNIDKKKQMPCIVSTLTKFVRFNSRLQGSTTADGPPAVRAQVQSVPARLEHYKMSPDCPGVALIFNHVKFKNAPPRHGSHKDADDIGNVLFGLGFDVRVFVDLTQDQVFETLRVVSRNEDHTDHDCLVVVMMTHGETGTLLAKDTDALRNPPYKVERFWEHFDDNACPGLAGKPKLLFIQASRGEQLDPGLKTQVMRVADTVDPSATPEDKGKVFSIPTMADLLVVYSTYDGYYSRRNPTYGSCFVQSLAKNLTEYGSKKDVLSLLTVVLRKVACNYKTYAPTKPNIDKKRQMPCIVSTLTKFVRFR